MSTLRLYSATTGALLATMDAADGLRQLDWKAEVPHQLQEAVEAGIGRFANYPAWIAGEGLSSNPIGQAPVTGTYSGATILRAVPQVQSLGTGDAGETDFGQEALTEPDPTHANYFNTTTDPDDPVAPRGGQAPAFLQTVVDGGGFNLAASSGVLSVRVNGTLYTITGQTGGAVTVENLQQAIITAGWPVDTAIEGGDTLRIFAPGLGGSTNILGVGTAGSVGATLFTGADQSSQPDVLYRGTGGPLGQGDNSGVSGGAKPQRRILPGSISITMTMGAEVITSSDDGAGVITGQNAAGTVTVAGTINYTTGAINLDTVGDAPDNATDVTARFKVLIPVEMHQPVRKHRGVGDEFAVLLN
jgi:hypothetical protein